MLRNNNMNQPSGLGGSANTTGESDWYSEGGQANYSSSPAAASSSGQLSPNAVWNNGGHVGGSTLHQRSNSTNSGNNAMGGAGLHTGSNGAALYYDQSSGGQSYSQPLSGNGQAYGGYNNQSGAHGGGNGGMNYGNGAAGGDMDSMNAKYGFKSSYASYSNGDEDYDNEPPLLEELGINLGFVWLKFLIVMFPNKDIQTLSHLSKLSFASFSRLIMKSGDKSDGGYAGLGGATSPTSNVFPPDFDSDMAGPVIAFLVLASLMLLAGKVNFGYIYGFSVCGCVLLHGVLELMYVPREVGHPGQQGPPDSPPSSLSIWETASTLGYSIIPVLFLAFINVFIPCNGTFGLLLSAAACGWCTYAATRLFDARMKLYKNNQFILVAYPVVLFYAVFCLITIF